MAALNPVQAEASDFLCYPAIDVRQGRVVRLAQGDYARETRYDDDPLAPIRDYAAQGAQWLHLVDLDAARAGGYTLLPLLARIRAETGLRVQTGGGVRGRDDVARILDGGADRVVIGSLAVRRPDEVLAWLEEFGAQRITVALDTRRIDAQWRLPVHGWTETATETLDDLVRRFAAGGLIHLLSTDIARDGMLSGPNLDLYEHLLATAPTLRVQASGGVRTVADVVAARARGCAGIVLGRALLERRFTLAQALSC
ncbi:1-(5-phosphoribosyl)-5-[(5-phosphoribosylamino)methylideneamino]imidazole-4-carboxamide isomerase [Pseudoxanthomonas mexicana]|uniref:1-(5-phosphoribosyl)-5-[(5- phosphoribosylamino)methylideneamino]imidazole-4- carboxamide isomerase n=1 Tax=Pseudoxanthomonas mexicana TaxID=128785 RepID=UPI00398AD4D6